MCAPGSGAESAALLCGQGCVSAADGGRGRETQALLPTPQLPGDRPQTGESFSDLQSEDWIMARRVAPSLEMLCHVIST